MNNTIADKLEQIAKNEQLIYNAGYEKGKAEVGESIYDDGMNQGRQDMNTAMMDAITCNGTKTEYRYAFWGEVWNDELFKPHTVIKPTNFQNGLYRSSIEYGAYSDLLDFSNCQNLSAAFMYSTVKKLKIIDARSTTSGFNGLSNTFHSCANLESIDEFYPSSPTSKAAFSNTFLGCSALTRIIFKSEIWQNGLDLHWSTNLSRESIESIINALSTITNGTTLTLSQTAKENAFTDEEWASLIATKPNWTISLA